MQDREDGREREFGTMRGMETENATSRNTLALVIGGYFLVAGAALAALALGMPGPAGAGEAEDLRQRGLEHMEAERYEEALADFTKALELKPDYANVWVNRGIVYQNRGQHDLALADFNKTLEFAPNDSFAYVRRGRSHRALGQRDKAMSDYNQAIKLKPGYAEAYESRGDALRESGAAGRAIADYAKAVELEPRRAWLRLRIASLRSSQGEHDLAIEECDRYIALYPDDDTGYVQRGLSFLRLKRHEEAILDLSSAIALEPQKGELYLIRAGAYAASGRFGSVAADYARFVETARASGDRDPRWTEPPGMETPRAWLAAAAVDGDVVAAGGWDGEKVFRSVETYDPAVGKWRPLRGMAVPRVDFGLAPLGRKLYAVGGKTDAAQEATARVEVYDAARDEWSEVAPLSAPRGWLAAASLDGRVYAAGGLRGETPSGVVERYDPEANAWDTVKSLPTPRGRLSLVAAGGKLYAIGGDDGRRSVGAVEAYDPATGEWRKCASMRVPRCNCATAVLKGRIYVFGGALQWWNGPAPRIVEVYDPATDAWKLEAGMPAPRTAGAAAVVGNRIYLVGGMERSGGKHLVSSGCYAPGGGTAKGTKEKTVETVDTVTRFAKIGALAATGGAFVVALALWLWFRRTEPRRRRSIPAAPVRRAGDEGRTEYPFAFQGRGWPLFGIRIFNMLKNIVTLGVYSFWGRVRVRNYAWGAVEVAGDRLAYHGTGMELFRGFLKACVIFIIPYMALDNLPAILGAPLWVKIACGVATVALLVLFVPVATVGMRRYRLSRTSLRNIRFAYLGKWWPYAKLLWGTMALTILTLGLYAPAGAVRRQQFHMSKTRFGSGRFRFTGTGRDLFGPYLLALVLAVPTLFLSMAWYGVYKQRYFWNNTRFERGRFACTIRFPPLLWIGVTNVLLVLFTFGLGGAWATVRYYRYYLGHLRLDGELDLAEILQQPVEGAPVGDELADYLDIDFDLG